MNDGMDDLGLLAIVAMAIIVVLAGAWWLA